jgi:hypothetical protein
VQVPGGHAPPELEDELAPELALDDVLADAGLPPRPAEAASTTTFPPQATTKTGAKRRALCRYMTHPLSHEKKCVAGNFCVNPTSEGARVSTRR